VTDAGPPRCQVSRAVASRVAVGAGALAAVVAAGVAIHLAYLALNTAAVWALRLGGQGPEGAPPQQTLAPHGCARGLCFPPAIGGRVWVWTGMAHAPARVAWQVQCAQQGAGDPGRASGWARGVALDTARSMDGRSDGWLLAAGWRSPPAVPG